MTDARSSDGGSRHWPTPEPGQAHVLLLGCHHMDEPGLDVVSEAVDDVLEARRQSELEALTDRLAGWEPDRIAVEWPHALHQSLNERYRAYRSAPGAFADPDGPAVVDSDGPAVADREEPAAEEASESVESPDPRSEVIQVGFRLAVRRDHDRVIAIDDRPDPPESNPFEGRAVDSDRKRSVAVPDPEAIATASSERLASSSIPAYLAWKNREPQLWVNHALMFDRGIRCADGPLGSPTAIAGWYGRNLRMVHHLWRGLNPEDDRVVLVVGAGHVRVLRHLLTEAPMFCPVSPLDLLPGPD